MLPVHIVLSTYFVWEECRPLNCVLNETVTFVAFCAFSEKNCGSTSNGGVALTLHVRGIGDVFVNVRGAQRKSVFLSGPQVCLVKHAAL